MDDLSAKLTELLSDPESMNRVRQMAESILGENDTSPAEKNESPLSGLGDLLGTEELGSIISVISHMKNSRDDTRVQLIHALRPHLGEERQKRADTAIKILKLLDVLPLLKDSGILKLLGD